MPSPDYALLDFRALDSLAATQSPLHSLDPRVKIIVTLAFILTVISYPRHAVIPILPLLLYPVALIALGRLPMRLLLGKLLIASPFALTIAIFSPLLESDTFYEVAGMHITAGWVSFASIMLRFALTVLGALILISTTGIDRIAGALTRMGVPHLFPTQILLLYRYAIVLAGEASRMLGAWRLRAGQSRAMPPRIFASFIAQLLLRALDRSERLHRAMLARGFSAAMPVGAPLRLSSRDIQFLLLWILFFLLARAYNLPLLVGRLLTEGLS